jgi:two-component system cell cycle sensor histidine kinase/response regulator CckA
MHRIVDLLRRRAAEIGLSLALLLLVAAAWRSLVHTDELIGDAEWRQHTAQVIGEIHGLLADVSAAEIIARTDSTEDDQGFRLALERGRSAVRRRFARLVELTADNPRQQARLEAMQPFLDAELAILAAIAHRDPRAASGNGLAMASLRRLERFRAEATALEAEENRLMKQRDAALLVGIDRAHLAILLMTGCAILLLSGSFLVLRREIRRREHADRELRRFHHEREVSSAAALRAYEDKYRLLFDEGPHPAYVADGETLRFLEVNRAAIAHYGYSREEFLGMTLDDIRPAEDVGAARQAAWQVLAGEHPGGVWRHLTKSGDLREISAATHRLEWAGRPAILAIIEDVTERNRLEDQLRHSQRMEAIGQLAGGVAHDFNNELTVVLGYAELTQDLVQEDGEARAYVEEIRKAGERAAFLTHHLLAFSRRQVLKPSRVDINDVVSDMASMLRRVIGETIELEVSLGREAGVSFLDPGQLGQVLLNLAVNARDAMPTGGRLVLETAAVDLDAVYVEQHRAASIGPHARIAVSDSGCGMDAPTRARIFEPFFTTKEKGKGTGLGLSTVYGIVRQSGGHIEVYSEVGKGTTFRIYFPRTLAEASPPPAPRAASPLAPGSETILLLEDEPAVRVLLRTVLEGGGYRVLNLDSVDEAVRWASQHDDPIDLLLADLVMPGTSGPEAVGQLSTLRPAARVLFMSGYSGNLIDPGIFAGGAHFLEKPFTAERLLRTVHTVLTTPSESIERQSRGVGVPP